MLSKTAVKLYLNRELEDNRPLKKLTHKQLDRMIDKLLPRPRIWHELGLHQKVGFYIGVAQESTALFLDMGSGKTLTALELLQYWWDSGQLRRALVFVTSDKAFPTWERQIKQYEINIPFCTLDSESSVGKWKTLDRFYEGIILLHYPGTVAMVSEPRKKKGRSKKKTQLSRSKVAKLLHMVDAVVFDEITKASNKGSLTYQLCNRVSKAASFRYGLAGRPFGRDPTPLWALMYLIDRGAALGPTLELFRAAFFTAKDNYWGGPRSKVYTFKERLSGTLSRLIQHSSITYTSDECIDLPPSVPIIEPIKLPPDTRIYYEELVNEVRAAKGSMKAIKSVVHRMRQLSSGFLGLKDDETGERAELTFAKNPKLERMLDLLDELPRNRKALIYYQYTHSGRTIVKALKDEFGIRAPWLWSGTKNAREDMRRFIEDGEDCPFIVVNNQVGAYSLDGLQVANYEFFYESPMSVIDREQAEKRIQRQGQEHNTCFFYDFVVKGTFDEKVLEFHKQGRDLHKALMIDPSRVLNIR